MMRIRALARSFSFRKHEDSLIDFYMSSISGPGLTPPLYEFTKLPDIGLRTGFYEAIRDFSIDSLTYINDLGYGVGFGIIVLSVGFKLLYSPIIAWGQTIALRTKMIAPEINIYNRDLSALMKLGDKAQIKKLKIDFDNLKKSYGIKTTAQIYSMTQVPFLLSFFYTLRELSNSPENCPRLLSDGFLWLTNLTIPDPYYILPIATCACNYVNIKNNTESSGMYGSMEKYMKYLAFLGLPISINMPSAIVLNWFIMSFFQFTIKALVCSKPGRKITGVPDVLPGSLQDKLSKKIAARNLGTIDLSKKTN